MHLNKLHLNVMISYIDNRGNITYPDFWTNASSCAQCLLTLRHPCKKRPLVRKDISTVTMGLKAWGFYGMICIVDQLSCKIQETFLFVNNCTPIGHSLYPFNPQYQHVYSHHCSTYVSYLIDWENLFKNPDISSLVIISFILINCAFDQAVILLGEIRCHCWDLKGYSLRCADMYIYHGIVSC